MANINIDIRVVTQAATAAIKKFSSTAQSSLSKINKIAKQNRETFQRMAFAATGAFIALTGVAFKATQAFIEYEKALIGVGKTTGLAGEELDDFGKEILDLSKTLPVTAKELLNIAQSAGQLGIRGSDNLKKFSTTVAKLGRTTNVSGEEAAISIARVLEVTGEGAEVVDRFGSTLVALGNNFAANESEILRATNEVARATAQFNVSSSAAAGLATTLKTFGVQAELTGSVTGRAFQAIGKAISEGGKPLTALSKLTGLTVDELKTQFQTNAIGVFQKFIQGLGKVGGGATGVTQKLKEFGLEGIRINAVLPTLAKRSETLARALRVAGDEFENPIALTEEFEAASQSLDARLVQLGNQFRALGVEIGQALLPIINVTIKAVTAVTDFFAGLGDGTKRLIAVLVGLTTVMVGVIAATAAVLAILPALTAATVVLTGAMTALGISTIVATLPFALMAAAVAGLIVFWEEAVVAMKVLNISMDLLVNNTLNAISSFFGLSEATDNGATSLDEYGKEASSVNEELEEMGVNALKAYDGIESLDSVLARTAKNIKARREIERKAMEAEKTAKDTAVEEEIQRKQKELESEQSFLTKKEELRIAAFGKRQELNAIEDGEITLREELEILREIDKQKRIAEIEATARQRRIGDAQATALMEQKIGKARTERQLEIAKKSVEIDEKENKDKLTMERDFWSMASGLSQSGNKQLAAIGRAATIANLARKAPEAIGNAYTYGTAVGGPVVGAAFGAVAAAFMAEQIANAGGGGFENGGIVGGTSFTGDRVNANVNSGEMILNRQQQSQLFQQANGRSGGSQGQEIVVNTTVELDSEVVGRSVSRQVANGLVLGEFE